MFIVMFAYNNVYAASDKVINNETKSTLIELKEREMSSLKDYEETYGSKSYGITAFILHRVQVYSIPFCFLGIVIAAMHKYILGIRHLESYEKGLALMITFVIIGVVCQVLPLVFTVVVKFGRE